jgi:hypothetical protein
MRPTLDLPGTIAIARRIGLRDPNQVRWMQARRSIRILSGPGRAEAETKWLDSCESGLVSGQVADGPGPRRARRRLVLVCCARPAGDVVIDL